MDSSWIFWTLAELSSACGALWLSLHIRFFDFVHEFSEIIVVARSDKAMNVNGRPDKGARL